MLLGIPRGFFYYDYIQFIRHLFHDTNVEIVEGEENDERILLMGNEVTVDEACMPVKLSAGQAEALCAVCDRVLVARVMKDEQGRWLCPKVLGLPELTAGIRHKEKLLVTEALYFNDEKSLKKALWKTCRELNVERKTFLKNFSEAYEHQTEIRRGNRYMHVEASWEFMPSPPEAGEIILPYMSKILLAGHCYNVYDKFSNGDIIRKLDEMCIKAVTEKAVLWKEKERAVASLELIKKPFWESLIRTLGTALCLRHEVEGIIYLSSFSCGPDAVILEMIKSYVPELPLMVLKLDEHRGEAGTETRLEAFADLLKKRRAI